MSHLRLTTSEDLGPAAAEDHPDPGALRFAGFTPMNDQPGLADKKAGFVIGAGGLLLSTAMFLVMPLEQFVRPGFWPALTLVLAIGLAGVTLAAITLAYRCCMLVAPAAAGNLLFVQNIAAGGPSDYAAALDGVTARGVLRDVLTYNHTMARLGVAKYRLAGRALLCLRVAIPLWVLLLAVVTARAA